MIETMIGDGLIAREGATLLSDGTLAIAHAGHGYAVRLGPTELRMLATLALDVATILESETPEDRAPVRRVQMEAPRG